MKDCKKASPDDYIQSPEPDIYLTPTRVLNSSGRQLLNSQFLVDRLSKQDGDCAEIESSWIIDFGVYIAGYYKQVGGKTVGSGDFTNPMRYPLYNGKWDAFRYVKATGKIDFMGVKLSTRKTFGARRKDYKGEFLCSDDLLNKIWYGAAYTVQLCAMHHRNTTGQYEFVDSPKRDRRLFLWFDSAGNETFYYAFGNTEVGKASYDYILRYARNGRFLVSDIKNHEALDVSGFLEIDLWELYSYSGDLSYLEKFYPEPINNHMETMVLPQKGKEGLYICNLALPVGPNMQCSMSNQSYVYGGLRSAAKIAGALGDYKKKNYYTEKAEELKEVVNKKLWSPDKGAYLYYQGADHIDQLGNSLAIVFGLADGEKPERILKYFQEHHWKIYQWKNNKKGWGEYNPAGSTDFDRPWFKGDSDLPGDFRNWAWTDDPGDFSNCGNYNYCISPWMNAWEIEAHFQAGRTQNALRLTKRCFGNMLRWGPGTFWEQADYNGRPGYLLSKPGKRIRTVCHRWSGKIGAVLSKYVLGISAGEPGFDKISIIPHCGHLTWAKGKVTTKHGEVKVHWRKNSKSFVEDIYMPRRCKGIFGISRIYTRIYINGKIVFDKGIFYPEAFIKGFYENNNYFYFNVLKGGDYHILAKRNRL